MSAIPYTDWGEVFNTYHSKVLLFVYRRTNNWHLAEDLASDVFVKAIDYSERNQQIPESFGAWLYRIAKNLVIDYYDMRAKRPQMNIEDLAEWPNPQDDPAREAEATLDREMLQAILNRLTATQAQALIMRYQEGCSFTEIADEMGKSEDAVKQLLHRACETANGLIRYGTPRPPRTRGQQTEVEAALRERGPMTVDELACVIKNTKSVVNTALYVYPQTFVKVGTTQKKNREINVWGLVGVHDGNCG